MRLSFRVAFVLTLTLTSCRDQTTQCTVDGVVVAPDTSPSTNTCLVCTPATSTTALQPVADGTPCGDGKVCGQGTCQAACTIAGALVMNGAAEPSNACRVCSPARSTTAYSTVADGTPCGTGQVCAAGTCAAQCVIAGVAVPSGATNPSNPCQQCSPAASTSAWVPRAAGTSCGAGRICRAQAECQDACFIAGLTYDAGQVEPSNACRACVPAQSTTSFSALADGRSCGAGSVCRTGDCTTACFIDGGFVDAGTLEGTNPCRSCQPAQSTSAYSNAGNGTACGADRLCRTGSCESACAVDGGAVVDAGATHPGLPCQTCQPTVSTSGWSTLPAGTACGSGAVCGATGLCTAQCFIDGGLVAVGASEPGNACRTCQAATSTTAYSPVRDGTSCGGGQVCVTGGCARGCFIDGGFVAPGVLAPAQPCRFCEPDASVSAYTVRPDGASCSACNACSVGVCGPKVLGPGVPGGGVPTGLLLHDGYAYAGFAYGNPMGFVARYPMDGGARETVLGGLTNPQDLRLVGDRLFISDFFGNRIIVGTYDGGAFTGFTNFMTGSEFSGLAASPTRLYWTENNSGLGRNGYVASALLTGGGVQYTVDGGRNVDIAVDGTHVYWTSRQAVGPGFVMRAPLGGGAPEVLDVEPGQVNSLIVEGPWVYWTSRDAGVMRVAKTGGVSVSLTGPQDDASPLVSDGQHIYFGNYSNGFGGRGALKRVPLDGGAVTTLVTNVTVSTVTVDNQCVYFGAYGNSSSLVRTDK